MGREKTRKKLKATKISEDAARKYAESIINTGCKQAEDALKESEAKHRFIFENAMEGIFQTTPEGKFISANPAQAKLLGYDSPTELMEQIDDVGGQHYVNPEHRQTYKNTLDTEGAIKGFETQLLKKDGTHVWVSISARAVRDNEGAVIYQGTAMDITDRKRLEEALENDQIRLVNDQTRLAAVLDSIDALVYVADFNSYEVLFLNKYGRKKWGNITGKRCWETLQEGRVGPCEFCTNDKLLSGTGVPTGVYRWEFQNTKNGEWYDCRDQAIRWIDGRLVRLEIATNITGAKRFREKLRESEEKFKAIFDSASDGILLADLVTKKFLQGNTAICSMLGYTKDEIEGLTVYDIHTPENIPHVLDEFEKQAKGEKVLAEALPVLRKDGSIFYADVGSNLVTIGGMHYLIGIFHDITDRKKTEEMLLNEKNKFLTLSESVPFGMVMIDIKGHFTYINPKFEELFGYDMEDIPDGRAWFIKAYPDPEYRKRAILAWVEDLKQAKVGQKRPRIFKVNCKDGAEKIVRFVPVLLETGEQIICCDDITEQKRLESELHTISLTDELTGLCNRRGFITLAGQQLKIAERTKKDMLLFFADLDKMKHINDTLGHQAGDIALVEAAAILKEVFRESDIMGRMGGDEFAILAIDTTDEAREVLVNRLHNTLDNYNKSEGRNYQLSLSIGIARYDPETPSTLDELMTQADTMMYEEKRNKQH